MTDEEFGRAIVNNNDGTYRAFGTAARTLLAARPEVTREAVEEFIRARGWKDPSRVSGDFIAAFSHFAPPREVRPIDTMDADAINGAFCRDYKPDETLTAQEAGIFDHCARIAHHLAQPAPVVDPDAEAKRLHDAYFEGYGVPSYKWESASERQRNVWRAVAAAKEAGREDHG